MFQRKTQINAFELIAVWAGISAFAHLLVGRRLIVFIDNAVALSILRKGSSKAFDLCMIAYAILNALVSMEVEAFLLGPLSTTDIFHKTSNIQSFKTFFYFTYLKNKLECKSRIKIVIDISKILLKF